MSEELRAILRDMLTELERLTANQLVVSAALSTLPHFSETDLGAMTPTALEKNREGYDALRKAIGELT